MKFALVVLGFLSLLTPCSSVAQDSADDIERGLKWYKDRLDTMVPDVRESLQSGMSEGEASIAKAVRFRNVVDGNVNAYAHKDDGERVVYISSGLLEVVDWVSTAMAAQTVFGARDCAVGFVTSLCRAIERNSQRARRNEPLEPFGNFFVYIRAHRTECHGLTESMHDDKQFNQLRDASITGSIAFVVGHELGHHVRGHVDHPPGSDAGSRRNEQAADEFAMGAMARAKINPIAGLGLMMVFAGTQHFDFEERPGATHPTGASRVMAMVEAGDSVMRNDPAYAKELDRMGKKEEWNQTMAQLRRLAQDQKAEEDDD